MRSGEVSLLRFKFPLFMHGPQRIFQADLFLFFFPQTLASSSRSASPTGRSSTSSSTRCACGGGASASATYSAAWAGPSIPSRRAHKRKNRHGIKSCILCESLSSQEYEHQLTFNHPRVDPGITERCGWRMTSSFRAVVFMDRRSRSYSPNSGASPLPTINTKSA